MFTYSNSLEQYMVPEIDFLRQNPEYHILCTGITVFNQQGKILLVQRAKEEMAFANRWEVPGGKVDSPDTTILHAAARELSEEAGLQATRAVRKVGEHVFGDKTRWLKQIFEMEVADTGSVKLDPIEHQDYVWASEEEVAKESIGELKLEFINEMSKAIILDAFKLRREAASV